MPSGGLPRAAEAYRAPTSIDVARRAGVSQATVSRFLNGKSTAGETADAIALAIAELGYRPNHSARSLVTNRTGLVAVILGDLLNGYYGELFTTVQKELARHGLKALIFEGRINIDSGPEELLADVAVDGVIVATSLMRPAQEQIILARQLPTVFLNRSGIKTADSVGTDNLLGGQLAADHLLKLGHTRFGMIAGPAGADAIVARTTGFMAQLKKKRVKLDPSDIEAAGFDYQRAYESALRLLGRASPPSAIFCHNDQIAVSVMNAAIVLGLRVPEDLSVVGFDDVACASWERIALTTVRQPIQEIGVVAVDLLVKRLKNPRRPIKSVVLPCTLVERRSAQAWSERTRETRRGHGSGDDRAKRKER